MKLGEINQHNFKDYHLYIIVMNGCGKQKGKPQGSFRETQRMGYFDGHVFDVFRFREQV